MLSSMASRLFTRISSHLDSLEDVLSVTKAISASASSFTAPPWLTTRNGQERQSGVGESLVSRSI